MRKSNREKQAPVYYNQYSIFEFTRLGMTAAVSIILIGSFMRIVFG